MAILEIVTLDENEAALRQSAEPVTDVRDPAFQQLIDDMLETLHSADGVGLAAPQIGRNIQMAVIETLPEYDDDGEPIEGSRDQYIIVNPKIVWSSRKIVSGVEGCLSIPGYLGEVDRNFSIRVVAQDRHGKRKRYSLKGWDARIFQHEIDHLNGRMFIDILTAPENYWTEEAYEQIQQEKADRETAEA